MRRHLYLQSSALALLALISYVGEGWGYFALYALVLIGLALVLIGVTAARALRSRLGWRPPTEQLGSVLARILSSFAIAVAIVVAAHLAVAGVARFSSEPIGAYPGGALSGEWVTEPPPDWSFAESLEEIQVQVSPESPRSVTTHFFIHEGHLYVGADFLFPFKKWIYLAQEDDRVTLRIQGKLYPRRAVRVRSPQEIEGVMGAVARKRGVPREDLRFLTEVWFFRMDPRAPDLGNAGETRKGLKE